MAHRLQAVFLMIIVGLVLPVAGSPLRFCTCAAIFLTAEQACGLVPDPDAGCGCEDEESPNLPHCLAAAKALPDGLVPDHFILPLSVAMDLPPAVARTTVHWRMLPKAERFSPHRAPPPAAIALYLRNRSLLL